MSYLTRLAVERRAPDMMKSLGLSSNFVAPLIGVSPIVLSRAFRGLQRLPNEKGAELYELLSRLIEFSDAVEPLKLPLDNAVDVQRMLRSFRERDITPQVVHDRLQEVLQELFQ